MKHNLMYRLGIFILLMPLLLSSFLVKAQEIGLNQTGSLTIEFSDKHSLVGSEYAIWHVADIKQTEGESGIYHYVNTEEFATVHFKWTTEDLDYWDFEASAPLIDFVGEYIDENNLTPYATGIIDDSNRLVFNDLPLGIYYVRQTKVGPEGYVVTSYLATIPNNKGEVNVTTNGKTDPYKKDDKKPESARKPSMVNTAAQILKDKSLIIGGFVLSAAACLVLIKKEKEDKS